PAPFLAFRPSENGVLTPLTSALVPERELSPETESRCGPPPGRTQLLERLSALCVYLGRACSLAGDIGRQPSLVLSGIAKGEVAGWAGACPASSSTRNSTLAETQRVARDEVEDHHRGLTI